MGRIYEKPPVVEAICEFRFESSQAWDWTVPGLVYSEVREDFPKKKERHSIELGLQTGSAKTSHSVKEEVERMLFVREDDKALIQVGRDLLAVNHLAPYPDWKTFRAMIARALGVYRKIASPEELQSIGVRYINRLELQGSRAEIEDYLQAAPSIPETLPQTFASWVQRTQIPFEEANGMLAIQSGSLHDGSPESQRLAFMLDLDFRTLRSQDLSLDEALFWVDRAHDEIERAFEACVTDKSRELFQEVDHA